MERLARTLFTPQEIIELATHRLLVLSGVPVKILNLLLAGVLLWGCSAAHRDHNTENELVSYEDVEFVDGKPDIIPDVVGNYLDGYEYPDSLLLDTAVNYTSFEQISKEHKEKQAMRHTSIDSKSQKGSDLSRRLFLVNQAYVEYLSFKLIRNKVQKQRGDLGVMAILIRDGSSNTIAANYLKELMDSFPDSVKEHPTWVEKRQVLSRPSLIGTTLFEAPQAHLFTKGSKDTVSFPEILQTLRGDALLVFTASWCGPCHRDYDLYRDRFQELEKQGVRVISYSVDHNHSSWAGYVEKAGYLGECYRDVDAFDSAMLKYLGIQSVPMYLLIDKQSEIIGKFSSAEMRVLFDRYL